MRRLLRTALAAAGVTTLLVAPANAAAETCATTYAATASDGAPHWFEGNEGGIPSDATLNDVAADSTTVLAVGARPDGTGGTTPVVYRRTGDAWHTDQIAEAAVPDTSTSATLDEVALSPSIAWAIGTWTDSEETVHPLVLKFDGTAWNAVPDFPGTGLPTAIAAVASGGYVGDSEGAVHHFENAGAGSYDATYDAPGAAAIDALSAYTGAAGAGALAGGHWGALAPDGDGVKPPEEDRTARLYRLAGPGVGAPEAVLPGDARKPAVRSLGAASRDDAVALDYSGHVWQLAKGKWTVETDLNGLPGSSGVARQIAAVQSGTGPITEAVAGSIASVGGAVWTRQRAADTRSAWSCATLSTEQPLNSVAIVNAQDMWAVGDGGTVRHLWAKPAYDDDLDGLPDLSDNCDSTPNPSQTDTDSDSAGDACDGDDDNDGRLDESDNCPTSANGDQADVDGDGTGDACDATDDRPQPAAPDTGGSAPPTTTAAAPTTTSTTTAPTSTSTARRVDTTVDQPEPKPSPRPRSKPRPKRLLTNLRVERRGRALVVKFRLTGRARVAITALRNGKVISKTGFHRLRKGKRKLVIRFRGKPPSNLKVVVRPVGKRRSS